MTGTESQRKWRASHLDVARAREREYARRNRAKKNENSRRWYSANKTYAAARAKAYKAANTEKRREWRRRRVALSTGASSDGSAGKYWKMIVAAYRGLCAYCGAPYRHMDHVIPLANGGAHVARNIRPACAPCNMKKHTATWTPRPWAATLPSEV